jgi:hypothetical protein
MAVPPAFAQTAPQQSAAAQTAFDEAMKLMSQGRTAEACPKFAAAQRLDSGMATQFRLAECYEKTGQLASAWANYVEVADAAKGAKSKDREAFARKRAAALEPRLSRLSILVPPALSALHGLEIKRDGSVVDKALWGTSIPVDPGEHVVVATAPGKKPWQGKSVATEQPARLEVTIPPLRDLTPLLPLLPPAATPAPPPAEPAPKGGRSAVPAILLGSLAAASAGAGVALLVVAGNKRTDALTLDKTILKNGGSCLGANMDPRCEDLTNRARAVDTLQAIAISAFIGAGALATGALTYLLWPAPGAKRASSTALHAAPIVGAGRGGLVLSGTF